ncbi:gfo/Idh/MocA family oxidoreductase [Virgibacillus halodenitrificans]|nr:gfo/Idh/MocA family oxidoreductase [Virgibacillus halodenitrificans]
MEKINIGMIGLDTSHVVSFTKLLHDQKEDYYVKGGRIITAFPGGSPDLPLSRNRLETFTKEIEETYQVNIVDSLQTVVENSDAILLESVDGGLHLKQLKEIVSYQKPIFIDKPFSLSSQDAEEMIALASKNGTPIMSTSALRFAVELQSVLKENQGQLIIGADCFGPMHIEVNPPGLFWYGIHTIEMLYTIMGIGVNEVTTVSNKDYDVVTASWRDGRFGSVRGNRVGNEKFGAIIHYENKSEFVDIKTEGKPYYASLLEEIISFFRKGTSIVPLTETLEIIYFIEAVNKSRDTRSPVKLEKRGGLPPRI